jgi:molecular chaperone GrpE
MTKKTKHKLTDTPDAQASTAEQPAHDASVPRDDQVLPPQPPIQPADAGAQGQSEQVSDETGIPGQSPPADELTKFKNLAEEYLNSWKRSAADFQNYKKQQERDRQNWIALANAELILQLLPIADDMDKAIAEVSEEVHKTKWFDGFALIRKKMVDAFAALGLLEIDAQDKKFDPAYHEAVLEEPVEGKERGIVVGVLQKGYTLNGKVIRAAMVKVSK